MIDFIRALIGGLIWAILCWVIVKFISIGKDD